MRRRDVWRLAGAALLLAACGKGERAEEPVWGKQSCAHCSMVLSDRRFGAQLLAEAGERAYFDDVGCMVVFAEEHSFRAPRAWVHDATTGRWLDARVARYAPVAGSPMDFGFEAHDSEGLSWDQMRERVLAKARAEQGEP